MSKHSKASTAGNASRKTSRQRKSPKSSVDPLQIDYPQKMLDEDDFVGLEGMREASRNLQRRRSMTDHEKLAALRAILTPPPESLMLDGPVQIVDRASYFIEALLGQIAVGGLTLDQTQTATLQRLKDKLVEAERILLAK